MNSKMNEHTKDYVSEIEKRLSDAHEAYLKAKRELHTEFML